MASKLLTRDPQISAQRSDTCCVSWGEPGRNLAAGLPWSVHLPPGDHLTLENSSQHFNVPLRGIPRYGELSLLKIDGGRRRERWVRGVWTEGSRNAGAQAAGILHILRHFRSFSLA